VTAPSSSRTRLAVATVLTGVAAGVAGAALTEVLHAVQHVAFGYTEDTFLTGVERASSARRVLAVGLGGLIVGVGWWLARRRFTATDVSVTHALRERLPRLPILATLVDALLQIVAVGAGASLGREGAPRQVGAAGGGWIAARLGLSATQRRTLLACGAGAGLAAVYNVPFGGAAFTLEVLLGSIAVSDVAPAVVTSLIAAAVAWPVLGRRATYPIATVHLATPVLVWAVLVAPVAGVVGVLFVRLTTAARTHAVSGWRSVIAIPAVFACLGAAAMAYPQLLGNGKGPTELAFTGAVSLSLAALLVVLKPLATAACLGSGAIGGLLTPALATGAALGACTGHLWTLLWPGAPIAQYAIVAAAAVLAVTQRAPLTATVLTLEFVGTGLSLLAPMVAAVALAATTAWLLDRHMTPLALSRSARLVRR
jgi:H+/Cl- antiporter ClcA